ncbi:MAG TPA: hypothetical protein VKA89_08425 [Solirubrobacterales bacterium]|nr:hypothetical protein [Solirubrobacterales bacterium]
MRSIHRKVSPGVVLGVVAILIALSGTSIALPGKNSVDSGDIKKNAVRTADVKNQNLRGIDVAADTLTGSDINESTLGTVPSAETARPTGAAGGDLSGTYPDPTLGSIVKRENQGSILDVTANGTWTSSGNIPVSCQAGERLIGAAAHFDGGGSSSNFAIQDINPDFTTNSVTGEGISDAGGGLANQVNFIVTAICLQ